VDVVEDEDQGVLLRQRLDEAADRRDDLLRAAQPIRQPEDLAQPLRGALGVVGFAEEPYELCHTIRGGGDVVELARVPDRLDEGPIRDPLPIRQAAPPCDERVVGHAPNELPDEARLSDAGSPEDGEELARAVADRLLERVAKPSSLPFTSDHGRVEASVPAVLDGAHVEDAGMVSMGLGPHRGADDPQRAFVDEDLSRLRNLLKPNGHLNGGSRDEPAVAVALAAREHFAGSDAYSRVESGAPCILELRTQLRQAFADPDRCAHRAKRIVLVKRGNAEER
jgi:hypothetical protein